MSRKNSRAYFRLGMMISFIAQLLFLAACQGGLPFKQAPQVTPTARTPTPAKSATPHLTHTPLPTLNPTQTPILPTPTSEFRLSGLLADFPLTAGTKLLPDQVTASENSASLTLPVSQGPGELDAFYRKALTAGGWMLRFAEATPVGGFVQEWKKEKTLLTVEVHFPEGQPVLQADMRVIETGQALVSLLGFPLPNGTEVLRAQGAAVDLYVPMDYQGTVDFFNKQLAILNIPYFVMKPTAWCGSLGCQEDIKAISAGIALEPTPTPEKHKAEYYRAVMPDYTEVQFSLLPRETYTRVYINVNFKTLNRAGLPVALYPKATVTGIKYGVAMFEMQANLKDVIKFYEDGLSWLGWKAYTYPISKDGGYSHTWTREKGRFISLTLTSKKDMVYATLTCSNCTDPNLKNLLRITPTSTTAPSR